MKNHASYRGRVRKGSVVLDTPLDLPDGTEVAVRPRRCPKKRTRRRSSTLAESLAQFIGSIEAPADFASNHDHYVHGRPRRR